MTRDEGIPQLLLGWACWLPVRPLLLSRRLECLRPSATAAGKADFHRALRPASGTPALTVYPTPVIRATPDDAPRPEAGPSPT